MDLPWRRTGKSSEVFDAFRYLWIMHTNPAPEICLSTERQRCPLVSFSVKTILALAANMQESPKSFSKPWVTVTYHGYWVRVSKQSLSMRTFLEGPRDSLEHPGKLALTKLHRSQVLSFTGWWKVFLGGINNEMDGFCISQIHSPGPHLISWWSKVINTPLHPPYTHTHCPPPRRNSGQQMTFWPQEAFVVVGFICLVLILGLVCLFVSILFEFPAWWPTLQSLILYIHSLGMKSSSASRLLHTYHTAGLFDTENSK